MQGPYTVILWTGGNEASAGWDGRKALVAADHVAVIAPDTPGGTMDKVVIYHTNRTWCERRTTEKFKKTLGTLYRHWHCWGKSPSTNYRTEETRTDQIPHSTFLLVSLVCSNMFCLYSLSFSVAWHTDRVVSHVHVIEGNKSRSYSLATMEKLDIPVLSNIEFSKKTDEDISVLLKQGHCSYSAHWHFFGAWLFSAAELKL